MEVLKDLAPSSAVSLPAAPEGGEGGAADMDATPGPGVAEGAGGAGAQAWKLDFLSSG